MSTLSSYIYSRGTDTLKQLETGSVLLFRVVIELIIGMAKRNLERNELVSIRMLGVTSGTQFLRFGRHRFEQLATTVGYPSTLSNLNNLSDFVPSHIFDFMVTRRTGGNHSGGFVIVQMV
jgi:hypothetical protein